MLQDEALDYHRRDPPGKVGLAITKPFDTQHDLALAYTPGVAAPVLAIAADPAASFAYTSRANLVAVVLTASTEGARTPVPLQEARRVAREMRSIAESRRTR